MLKPFRLRLFLVALLTACSDAPPPAAAPVGGDFVLQSAAGVFDTRAQRGKLLLVYFGYTNCPDNLGPGYGTQAINRLAADERTRVRMVMISVDPERDTPQRLKEYVAYFHPEMVGLTGTPAAIAAVAKSYGAVYERQPPRADGNYVVDHSPQTYVVAPDGRLAAVLEFDAPVDKIAATVRKLL